MKKRMMCLLMTMVMMVGILPFSAGALTFPDVAADEDYAEAVAFVSDMGVMIGDNNGNFNPDKTVSRAEMAVIICKMMGETENLKTGTKFSDVPQAHWANAYITKAAELGAISGYNGKFSPADTVTYEQAVTMVIQAEGGGGEAQELGGYPNGFIEVASAYELLHGIDAEIGDELSRSKVAILVYNLLKEQ